jgi:hypothetical protein
MSSSLDGGAHGGHAPENARIALSRSITLYNAAAGQSDDGKQGDNRA